MGLFTETPYTVGPLTPKRQTISRFSHQAEMSLQLTNHSLEAIPFRISAQDKEHGCQFEFHLPNEASPLAGMAEFSLPRKNSETITIRLVLPTSPLIGFSKRTHYISTTLTNLGDGQQRTQLSEIRQPALIGPVLLLILLLTISSGLWYGINLALPWLTEPATVVVIDPEPTPEVTATPTRPAWVDNPPTPIPTPEIITTPVSYTEIFQQVGLHYQLDWRLLAATAYVESRFDPYALGRDGDMGLMQIIPPTWGEWAPKVGVTNPYDPYSNVRVGAAYMAYLKQYCAQRGYPGERWMLVTYNWGPSNLNRFAQQQGQWEQLPAKQQRYARDILNSRTYIEWQIPTPTP